MSDEIDLHYRDSPSVLASYPRALYKSAFTAGSAAWPSRVLARQDRVPRDLDRLARYRALCGFENRDVLPLVFPHVLAFPLQMAVMTHRLFPINLLGLIHVRNRIVQYRTMSLETALSIEVSVDAHRELDNGREFELVSRVFTDTGALAWYEASTMRARRATSGSHKSSRSQKTPATLAGGRQSVWSVPANLGRRYAAIAGDYNPIHLGRLPARFFGFSRPIATGMWLQARAAAELGPHIDRPDVEMEVDFKKPVLMPANPTFEYVLQKNGGNFMLADKASERIHMTGTIGALEATSMVQQPEVHHADS